MFRSAIAALALVLMSAPMASAAPSINPADMPAGTWVVDKTHASLIARVRHMGLSAYTVRFTDFDADYTYDPKAPAASKVTATFQAASLDTGNAKFNGEFADKFLDATANPTITFVSTAITPGEGNTGTMTGDLTFRGVIKRSDFGSTFLLRPPLAMVGDEVELILALEFVKK